MGNFKPLQPLGAGYIHQHRIACQREIPAGFQQTKILRLLRQTRVSAFGKLRIPAEKRRYVNTEIRAGQPQRVAQRIAEHLIRNDEQPFSQPVLVILFRNAALSQRRQPALRMLPAHRESDGVGRAESALEIFCKRHPR